MARDAIMGMARTVSAAAAKAAVRIPSRVGGSSSATPMHRPRSATHSGEAGKRTRAAISALTNTNPIA